MLQLKEFSVRFGDVEAVRKVSLQINPGQVLGLVGASGSGKSALAHAMMGLLPQECVSGQMVREKPIRMGMIFQDPMTALNPTMRIGKQIGEGLALSRTEIIQLLAEVEISDPALRIDQYPHVLSGGMRQRVMIAIALARKPDLLIADEPSTALDVIVQKQILELLKRINNTRGTSILFITHNLKIVSGFCDSVAVMYAGELVESGSVHQLFHNPQHPYTKALLEACRVRM